MKKIIILTILFASTSSFAGWSFQHKQENSKEIITECLNKRPAIASNESCREAINSDLVCLTDDLQKRTVYNHDSKQACLSNQKKIIKAVESLLVVRLAK